MKKLIQQLKQIDQKGYKLYKTIQGSYTNPKFRLFIDYVQGDPFAAPSKIRIHIPSFTRMIREEWIQSRYRKIAVEDAFARSVAKAIKQQSLSTKGSGKSGLIFFDAPGQEILERTAVQINLDGITICMAVGLPANGRKINSREAEKLFSVTIPTIIQHSIFTITDEEIEEVLQLTDQQVAIRKSMEENNWIAFIANGSILPRESGISNQPLKQAVPFQSPKENEVSIAIPHQEEPVKGMAIPKGITLIVGGGYHGKSTLLQAMERGVYFHKKGDGREFVLTDPNAVKIRAEDGRKISGVNISPFITNLPFQQDTTYFSTENASGSTSQAANVMEAIEVGATTLLIDEDTSATNFMIRDFRMQELVVKEKEPITPFIDRVKQIYDNLGVSTIIVMGGSGDYFAVSDTVIMMDEYLPYNVTKQVAKIMKKHPLKREMIQENTLGQFSHRTFDQRSLQTKKGKRNKTDAKGLSTILMGKTEISFEFTEQLVDPSQTRMIAEIIQYLDREQGLGNRTLSKVLEEIEIQIDEQGLSSLTPYQNKHPGDLARPRKYEIAAVFNRMRTARIRQN